MVGDNGKISLADSIRDIEEKASTGKFPFYLMPEFILRNEVVSVHLIQLKRKLRKKYKIIKYYDFVPGGMAENGDFLKPTMVPCCIFDLENKHSRQLY